MKDYKQIFSTMVNLVDSDGGDGSGVIVSLYHDYKEVSKAFEVFYDDHLKSLGITGRTLNPIEESDYVLWTDRSNENILITNNKKYADQALKNNFGDYIIVC